MEQLREWFKNLLLTANNIRLSQPTSSSDQLLICTVIPELGNRSTMWYSAENNIPRPFSDMLETIAKID
jgi:hypothetical protein